jgi:hypothetical protein
MVGIPSVPGFGVKFTKQLLAEELIALSVQVADGEKEPELVLVKVTVPAGELGVAEVSCTNAVHRVAWLTGTVDGLQLTVVLVLDNCTARPQFQIFCVGLPAPDPNIPPPTM